jgi:hypothetical protein
MEGIYLVLRCPKLKETREGIKRADKIGRTAPKRKEEME